MLTGGQGTYNATLADLKFITGTVKRYSRDPVPIGEPRKSVRKRANLVDQEYVKHAVSLDVKFCNTPKAGRASRRLKVQYKNAW